MDPSTRLIALLQASERPFTILDHGEARSAEDAARARGTPLAIGGKSLLMKLERIGFAVVVVGGDRRLDGRRLRRGLGVQRYRFASADELRERVGVEPGSVPPFGRPLFDVALVVDAATAAREHIAFAAASPTRSVVMAVADWLAVARPDAVAPLTDG